MKIGLVVNDPKTERPGFTSTTLACAARRRGHEVWHIGVADLVLDRDDRVIGLARKPEGELQDPKAFISALRAKDCPTENVIVDELDVLFLRNDPAEDADRRHWACMAGVNFGRFAKEAGVLVVNDPDGLNHAANKLYLQHFAKEIRPPGIVSRHQDEIIAFVNDQSGPSVIKPLTGSGGHDVFVLDPNDQRNTHQMIEAVTEDGFALVQGYVEGAEKGDIRLFLVDGEILTVNGKPALVRRRGKGGDLRHNLSAGGKSSGTDLTPEIVRIADALGPRLRDDGIFLAGVDIIGDRVLEINVFSPGAMPSASRLYGVDFEDEVIARLERKASSRTRAGAR